MGLFVVFLYSSNHTRYESLKKLGISRITENAGKRDYVLRCLQFEIRSNRRVIRCGGANIGSKLVLTQNAYCPTTLSDRL